MKSRELTCLTQRHDQAIYAMGAMRSAHNTTVGRNVRHNVLNMALAVN
jgi:hypothetical protein